ACAGCDPVAAADVANGHGPSAVSLSGVQYGTGANEQPLMKGSSGAGGGGGGARYGGPGTGLRYGGPGTGVRFGGPGTGLKGEGTVGGCATCGEDWGFNPAWTNAASYASALTGNGTNLPGLPFLTKDSGTAVSVGSGGVGARACRR